MNNFFEDLRKYFEKTSRKQVLKDWKKSQEFNKVSPTVEEFLENNKKWECYEIHTVQARMYGCSSQCGDCKIEQQKKSKNEI